MEAGRVVGISLVDHLVVARGGEYRSLAREGLDAWAKRILNAATFDDVLAP
jgi:hypothetical protein